MRVRAQLCVYVHARPEHAGLYSVDTSRVPISVKIHTATPTDRPTGKPYTVRDITIISMDMGVGVGVHRECRVGVDKENNRGGLSILVDRLGRLGLVGVSQLACRIASQKSTI